MKDAKPKAYSGELEVLQNEGLPLTVSIPPSDSHAEPECPEPPDVPRYDAHALKQSTLQGRRLLYAGCESLTTLFNVTPKED